jgi:glycosyltransferase involved in cell wall biosynthesis
MKIAVVILTYNESKHIGRCLDSMKQVSDDIYIIDAFSTDDTVAIAEQYGAKVFSRKWLNYADQFQWALENCGIITPWVMRMDADEYLEPALIKEIQTAVIPDNITGIYIRRKVLLSAHFTAYLAQCTG